MLADFFKYSFKTFKQIFRIFFPSINGIMSLLCNWLLFTSEYIMAIFPCQCIYVWLAFFHHYKIMIRKVKPGPWVPWNFCSLKNCGEPSYTSVFDERLPFCRIGTIDVLIKGQKTLEDTPKLPSHRPHRWGGLSHRILTNARPDRSWQFRVNLIGK